MDVICLLNKESLRNESLWLRVQPHGLHFHFNRPLCTLFIELFVFSIIINKLFCNSWTELLRSQTISTKDIFKICILIFDRKYRLLIIIKSFCVKEEKATWLTNLSDNLLLSIDMFPFKFSNMTLNEGCLILFSHMHILWHTVLQMQFAPWRLALVDIICVKMRTSASRKIFNWKIL